MHVLYTFNGYMNLVLLILFKKKIKKSFFYIIGVLNKVSNSLTIQPGQRSQLRILFDGYVLMITAFISYV